MVRVKRLLRSEWPLWLPALGFGLLKAAEAVPGEGVLVWSLAIGGLGAFAALVGLWCGVAYRAFRESAATRRRGLLVVGVAGVALVVAASLGPGLLEPVALAIGVLFGAIVTVKRADLKAQARDRRDRYEPRPV